MNKLMKFRILILAMLTLPMASCRTAKDVAVTSFRVIDAPANYIRRHIDEESQPTTTTTEYQSDVVTPGAPIAANPRSSQSQSVNEEHSSTKHAVETKKSENRTVATEPKPKPTPIAEAMVRQSPEIPYAKPVPGKPGYVYSPFDASGGYVDVTGYKPGSKVKDPYSGKIFLVP